VSEPAGAAPTTAYDWLKCHAGKRPTAVAFTEWQDGGVVGSLSFAELAVLVDRVALALVAAGACPGERTVLALPNDASFIVTLLAAFAAGLIAVPTPPPPETSGDVAARRLRGIAADCGAAVVVTRGTWVDEVRALLDGTAQTSRGDPPRTGTTGGRSGLSLAEVVDEPARDVRHIAVHSWEELCVASSRGQPGRQLDSTVPAREIAFLQYTSGSTGHPKGVAVSHRAVAAQCAQAAGAYGERIDDVAVTWVPLSHDMGLVTGVLRPLYTGYASVLLSPREFARTPRSWLSALSDLRGTLSSAPDFAYAHCVRRIPPADVSALDLSSWRVARNAGEVVRADTANQFAAHFAPAGFRPRSHCPSYGMAEATLTVTTSTPARPALQLTVRRHNLQSGVVRPAAHGSGGAADPVVALLSSGEPLPGTEVTVRDAAGRTLPDGVIGEVWIRGPQVFNGYWPDIAVGRETGPYRTRDCGFLYCGHLFVHGRVDDMLVYQGRNHYAADIVAALADLPGVRPGRAVVFATMSGSDVAGRGHRLCLLAELTDPRVDAAPRKAMAVHARKRLAAELGLYVDDVFLLPPHGLPVTSSGKVCVSEACRLYEEGRVLLL
jgi:acyl-CoA synthetase (AMP-forming)/AMP-acid ligase II